MATILIFLNNDPLNRLMEYESSIIPVVGDTYSSLDTPILQGCKVVGRQLLTDLLSSNKIIIKVEPLY